MEAYRYIYVSNYTATSNQLHPYTACLLFSAFINGSFDITQSHIIQLSTLSITMVWSPVTDELMYIIDLMQQKKDHQRSTGRLICAFLLKAGGRPLVNELTPHIYWWCALLYSNLSEYTLQNMLLLLFETELMLNVCDCCVDSGQV